VERLANLYENAFYENLVRGVTSVSQDILDMMEKAIVREEAPAAKGMLETLIKNATLAKERKRGVCQSPGIPCIYVRVGREMAGIDVVKITGKAIVQATQEGYLRPSIVHPLTRKNTGNNSGPGIPNFEIELEPELEYLETIVSFKGCGPELFNAFKTFTPESLGKNLEGFKRFVLEKVIDAGGKPCPPIGLGIGIGGQMDGAATLSRRAIRPGNGPYGAGNPRQDQPAGNRPRRSGRKDHRPGGENRNGLHPYGHLPGGGQFPLLGGQEIWV
jgi:fumarate hydratase subunit alpha